MALRHASSQDIFNLEASAPPRLMPTSHLSLSFGPPEVKPPDSRPGPLATSPSSSSSPSPRSSLYLAVKIRSLVNAFRKRAKRRSQAARKSADDTSSFCLDIEREAYGEIDRYLGRKLKRCAVGNSKTREGAKRAVARDGIGSALACDKVKVKRSLANINNAASLNALSLATLATHDELFLSRKADLIVKRLSIKELQHLIINVRDLLDTIRRASSPRRSAPSLPKQHSAGPPLDLTYLANLEHLLLCLQSQLLRQLINHCVELVRDHIIECQRTHQRSCEDWFFEFPDSRPPLSTTWPWAIKPSLAVLWGVCWMFPVQIYSDKEGNAIDQYGKIWISRQQLEHWRLYSDPAFATTGAQHRTQHHTQQLAIPTSYTQYNNTRNQMSSASVLYSQYPGAYPLGASAPGQPRHMSSRLPANATAMMGTQAQPQPQHAHPQGQALTPRLVASPARPYNAYFRESRHPPFCLPYRKADTEAEAEAAGQHQAPGSFLGLGRPDDSNTAYPAPPAAAHSDSVAGGAWLPEDTNFPPPPQGYSAYIDQYQWQAPNHAVQGHRAYPQPAHNLVVQTESLPQRPRSTGHLTPTITVTTQPYTPDSQAQPQDSHHTSATSLYAPRPYDTAVNSNQQNHYFSRRSPGTGMAELQVQVPPPQVGQVGQVGPSNGINSPISDHPDLSRPISPNPPMTDPNSRKRSFSDMSQGPPAMQMVPDHQSPQPSAYETSPGGMEDAGHKVQRMIKRGDPPQAHDGKYYCNFAQECADQYFDRKCEWSKHMDKHDRPYRCPQAQCAKLQGFTYSGGLLRHEREVHGKHGGPKEQLRCTVPDCKRHTGKGFTRKENLNEHLRRVHGITSSTDTSHLRQIAVDAAPGAEMMENSASRFSDTGDVDEFTTAPPAYPDLNKRRRLDTGASTGPDDLELELQRLKADNQLKDERIRRMEERDADKEARMKSLEDKLMQLTSHGLQRVPEQAHMGTYPEFDGTEAMQQVQEP